MRGNGMRKYYSGMMRQLPGTVSGATPSDVEEVRLASSLREPNLTMAESYLKVVRCNTINMFQTRYLQVTGHELGQFVLMSDTGASGLPLRVIDMG